MSQLHVLFLLNLSDPFHGLHGHILTMDVLQNGKIEPHWLYLTDFHISKAVTSSDVLKKSLHLLGLHVGPAV